jgi:hypothetical protein
MPGVGHATPVSATGYMRSRRRYRTVAGATNRSESIRSRTPP